MYYIENNIFGNMPQNTHFSAIQSGILWDGTRDSLSHEEREEILRVISELPAVQYREEILWALQESPIIIVEGETGSGKSTQIPKAVLEPRIFGKERYPNIIVTQPRVSAATGLANRVSRELLAQTENPRYALGDAVGYRTGRGSSSEHQSQISFHTTMYELMRLTTAGRFPKVYMLDEIHTDDVGNIMLSKIVRDELEKNHRAMKLILSSATMDKEKIIEYFSKVSKDIPFFQIEWRTFPIKENFAREHQFFEFFDYFQVGGKNMLIFEPGKKEIDRTIEELTQRIGTQNTKIFAFHSDISIEEQRYILDYQPNDGENVVIVATNSAEESLTVSYLDVVIDRGKFKVSSTGYDGVERLDTKNVSEANYRQRIGRSGRTKPGESVRVNNTPMEELDAFKKPEISLGTLEREVLMFAKLGRNFLDEMAEAKWRGEKFLLDEADPKLLALSYERLYLHGAIDERGNITALGESCLRFPLDFFHAKILHEAVKRDVSKDIIDMVCILEIRGFLDGKGEWKNFYKQHREKHFSDLDFQRKVLGDFLSKNLDEKTLNFYGSECDFGFGWRKDYQSGEKMFFEVLDPEDLEIFGVNKRALQKIAELSSNLYETFEKNSLPIMDTGSKDNRILALLSGNLHNIFLYNRDEQVFEGAFATRTKLPFTQSNTSIIQPENRAKNTYYVWEPFIIGGDQEREDFNLLAFITPVTDEHIAVFASDIHKDIPWFDVLHNTPKARALRGYLAELSKKDQYEMIDLKEKKLDTIESLFRKIEYGEDYAILISILRDIEEKKIQRWDIVHLFEHIHNHRRELQRIFRKNSWIYNFLESLGQLQNEGNFVLSGIEYGYRNPNQLFMNDPIFSEQGINASILHQKNLYRSIVEMTRKGDLVEFLGRGEVLSKLWMWKWWTGIDVINTLNDILGRLFHGDVRKRKNAEHNLQKFMTRFSGLSEYLKALSTQNVRTSLNHQRISKKIKSLAEDIRAFQEENANFKKKVQYINFDEILFHLPSEKYGWIFSKKYFYDVSFWVVFEELFLGQKVEEEKIYEKIRENFSGIFSEQEIKMLAHLISSTASYSFDKNSLRREWKEKLSAFQEKIQEYFQKSQSEEYNTKNSLEKLENHQYYQNVFLSLEGILLEYFEEDYVGLIQTRIFDFASKVHESNMKNFDGKIKKFISELDFSKLIVSGEKFSIMDDYNYNVDTLKHHFWKYIRDLLYLEKTPVHEVYEETEKLEHMLRKTEWLQKNIKKI